MRIAAEAEALLVDEGWHAPEPEPAAVEATMPGHDVRRRDPRRALSCDLRNPSQEDHVIRTGPTRPIEEITRLGDEIYERDVRKQVEADHDGEVVAIDVESGSWTIADTVIAATDLLRSQRPEAIDVWCQRVGHRALYHFGGRSLWWSTRSLGR